jgi:nitrite reductase (NADH) large subunit
MLGVCALAALVLILTFMTVGPLPYTDSLAHGWTLDMFWRDGLWMQVSGYVLAVLTLLGLSFSLRKRWPRLAGVDYQKWRMVHGLLGALCLVVLILHTGLRLGDGVNFWLMLDYLVLALAGGLLGLLPGWRGDGTGPRSWAWFRRLHIALFWCLPVLLAFHVLAVYFY